MADATEPSANEERLKSALWYYVSQKLDDELLRLNRNATPQFIGALTELVWTQTMSVARDLETFAKHAGRESINSADAMLLARRNESLEELLRKFLEEKRAAEGRVSARSGTTAGRGMLLSASNHTFSSG
ncbi:kinetochore component CENP-S-domain-containing protein [Lineolata rhizophorae]|uniref:Kinetochore component CENP-S-domain-containing protein n=1 Tax=Lineolata rhizophorae TaxID=578093 RepID=A0A6A6P9A8_9PEZI|nr:kinetochore component CENP-S-domain-containing protein [Lineolata rhizophorae]